MNKEHVALLKTGVGKWNEWRMENPEIIPDLSGAKVEDRDLSNLDLSKADLDGCSFDGARLIDASLAGASMLYCSISHANLNNADLSNAYMERARFFMVSLSNARLNRATLFFTTFYECVVKNTDLTEAWVGRAQFIDMDLSDVKGLESIAHQGPSHLDIDTIYRSKRMIPEVFLRGCGVPEALIEQIPSLVGAMQPIQFHSCFISYSSRDEEFARKLHNRMRQEDLRVWFAPEEMKGGQKLFEQIHNAIQMYDKLLLVLSPASIESEWVMTEIRRAFKTERTEKRRKLFPIRLVDIRQIEAWECFDADSGKDLAVEVREYFIPDFSFWKEHDAFEAGFARLMNDLRTASK